MGNKNKGFTLLEMLIALSVISVGVMAAFTLSTANLNTAKANGQRILAANLAREGVEFIRNVRDTNWLRIEANLDCHPSTPTIVDLCPWDYGLDQTTSTISFDTPFADFSQAPLINPPGGVNAAKECFADDTCALDEKNESGESHLYLQRGDSGSRINMARLIILKAICYDSEKDEVFYSGIVDCPETHKEKIGLQVTSQVFWVDFSKEHTIEVVEELYNWREYEN